VWGHGGASPIRGGVAGVPNGVDEYAAWPQHAANLISDGMDFLG